MLQHNALPCPTGSRQRYRKVTFPKGKSLVAWVRGFRVLPTLFADTVDSEFQERPRDRRLYGSGFYQVRFQVCRQIYVYDHPPV